MNKKTLAGGDTATTDRGNVADDCMSNTTGLFFGFLKLT